MDCGGFRAAETLACLSGQERARMRQKWRWQTARHTRKRSDRPPGGDKSTPRRLRAGSPTATARRHAAPEERENQEKHSDPPPERVAHCTPVASKSRIAPPKKPRVFSPRAEMPIQQSMLALWKRHCCQTKKKERAASGCLTQRRPNSSCAKNDKAESKPPGGGTGRRKPKDVSAMYTPCDGES